MSHATIVDPTGVSATIDMIIPADAQITEMTAEHTVTPLKFLKTFMADMAGNMISAEIRSEPTRFMATTITEATTTAISRL